MLQRLDLCRSHVDELIEHALEVYPEEACGFITGHHQRSSRIVPLPNKALDAQHAFEVAPHDLLSAYRDIEAHGELVLAVYHSHPHSAPIPSEDDVAHTIRHYPQLPQLIIGFRPSLSMKAWLLAHNSPLQVQVVIHEETRTTRFTSVQIMAILLAVLISALIFFAVSFSLLPPAPPIPTPAG